MISDVLVVVMYKKERKMTMVKCGSDKDFIRENSFELGQQNYDHSF